MSILFIILIVVFMLVFFTQAYIKSEDFYEDRALNAVRALGAIVALIFIWMLLGGCVQFDRKWTVENRRLETTYQVIHAADFLQTLQIENHPELHESNPLLGDHPTKGKILVWYMTTAYGHAYLTNVLDEHAPRWVCRTWQAASIIEAGVNVRGNYQLGLRWGF